MITGIRGLCNGLGPALYGFVFYLFHVELTDPDGTEKGGKPNMANPTDEVVAQYCYTIQAYVAHIEAVLKETAAQNKKNVFVSYL